MNESAVLDRYDLPQNVAARHGDHPRGFSGARVWRVVGPENYCLRLWPRVVLAPFVTSVHGLLGLAADAGLEYVPRVIPTRLGESFVETVDGIWELTTWMPGVANYHEKPGREKLEAACRALAKLHLVWEFFRSQRGFCPGIGRRWQAFRAWNELRDSGWRPQLNKDDPVAPDALRALAVLDKTVSLVPGFLQRWETVVLPLQACHCDIRHDHVLFSGNKVTGIVDYGSVKWDHPAVDLARLLGSLVGDDSSMRSIGFAAYRTVRGLSAKEEELVVVLDRTGTILGAANWLRWLYQERRHYEDREAVARRLRTLVERMEKW